MQIYACWDGDHLSREVGRAVMSDDVAGVRRVDQAISLGNELWRSFALKFDGTVIEIGGEAGRIEFGAKHLTELPAVAEQYAKAVGATISVGVGMKLSESARALLVAKRRGGNQVVLWHPDMTQELEASTDPKEEVGEPLGKTAPSKPIGAKRVRNQGDHEQGAVVAQFVKDHPAPVVGGEGRGPDGRFSASTTPKAEDLPTLKGGEDVEGGLHGEASKQKAADEESAQQDDAGKEQLRAQLVKVLQLVKAKVQVISQLQQVDPEAFQAIMALVQGVVALGRQTVGEVDVPAQPVQKAEDLPVWLRRLYSTTQKSADEYSGSPKTEEGELEKDRLSGGGGPIPGVQPYAEVEYPVGTLVAMGGTGPPKLKVEHGDGKETWKQVTSDGVASQDPRGVGGGKTTHVVPSRQPAGS